MTVTMIIVGVYRQQIHEEGSASLRKNERPHNVNSCNKCSCTAGGNGYCNYMFLCLNSLNSQELECAQLPTVAQTKVFKAYNVINPFYREK